MDGSFANSNKIVQVRMMMGKLQDEASQSTCNLYKSLYPEPI